LKKKIFNVKKIKLLKDPIINNKIIFNKKKERINDLPINEDFYLGVGRLTKQKNFSFLIEHFAKNLHKFKVKKLIIIGTGEESQNLDKIIIKYNAQNNIILLGFKKNIYKYLTKVYCVIIYFRL
jgi:glycosyltransferase involved in cell wall biosynthesis